MGWWTDSCCCFSLRTGSLILGYLSLISQIFTSFVLILQIIYAEETVNVLIKHGLIPDTDIQHRIIYALLVTFLGTLLIISLAHGVISVFLLLGVYEEREKYLQIVVYAWVAFDFFAAITGCARAIYQLGLGSYGGALFLLFFTIIGVLLGIYFIVVIHSYRKELKEGKKNSKLTLATHA